MNALFTLTQALQLVGLTPAIFLVIFLLTLSVRDRQAVIPALYFTSLACGFILPLLHLHPMGEHNPWVMGTMLVGESLLVALSFLLILQFVTGHVPPLPYWLVLTIPLIGGGEIIRATIIQARDGCAYDLTCPDAVSIKALYNIFSSSLVFLLLIYYSRASKLDVNDANRKHKYWLIVSLILLHLFVLAVDLGKLSGHMSVQEADLTSTILRLTFIYLVITSLFRVFNPTLVTDVIHMPMSTNRQYHPELDRLHVQKLSTLLEHERVYREMRLNRAALARKVGISEHHLSRIINGHYARNFNELINGFRIDEAKQRLKSEPTAITTIAFEVGFNSIASFNRVFKEKVGVSPTEYRGTAAA